MDSSYPLTVNLVAAVMVAVMVAVTVCATTFLRPRLFRDDLLRSSSAEDAFVGRHL